MSFSLLCPDLAAKDKSGARLEVVCRGSPGAYGSGDRASRRFVGELIAVRADSLLLVEEYSELDRSIEVRDIVRVTVLKKSKAGTWALYGLAAGLCAGVLYGAGYDEKDRQLERYFWGALGAGAGGAVGLAAASIAKGETFEFEGRPESRVQEPR